MSTGPFSPCASAPCPNVLMRLLAFQCSIVCSERMTHSHENILSPRAKPQLAIHAKLLTLQEKGKKCKVHQNNEQHDVEIYQNPYSAIKPKIRNQKSKIGNPKSEYKIQNLKSKSEIQNRRSETIRNPKFKIQTAPYHLGSPNKDGRLLY